MKGRTYILNLLSVLGIATAKESVHQHYQRVDFSSSSWWYLTMQLIADGDF